MANRLKLSSKFYDLDDYLFRCVTSRFAKNNTLNAFDFYAIVTWKSNRSISKLQKGLKSANLTPTAVMRKVSACASDKDKLKELVKVKGIGVRIASAILTVCYPRRFTILDFRAWEALHDFNLVKDEKMPNKIDSYFEIYLPKCNELASKQKMTLRKLDKAMWGLSKQKSIMKWTK
jgi:thermostable 8-oxoguanine DNA glycosylase